MITSDKLKVYAQFKGDVDMFARAGTIKEHELLSDEDFNLIDLLIQDATVINRKLGSAERTSQAAKRIEVNCDNDEVVQQIHSLVGTL